MQGRRRRHITTLSSAIPLSPCHAKTIAGRKYVCIQTLGERCSNKPHPVWLNNKSHRRIRMCANDLCVAVALRVVGFAKKRILSVPKVGYRQAACVRANSPVRFTRCGGRPEMTCVCVCVSLAVCFVCNGSFKEGERARNGAAAAAAAH